MPRARFALLSTGAAAELTGKRNHYHSVGTQEFHGDFYECPLCWPHKVVPKITNGELEGED